MASAENPPAPGKIHMITLHTDQYADMRHFYAEQLGLAIVSETDEFVEFSSQGIRLTLTSRTSLNNAVPSASLINTRSGSAVGMGFFYQTTQEVDRAYTYYKSQGIPFVAAPEQQAWGEYTAFFTDPDGNAHELAGGSARAISSSPHHLSLPALAPNA